MKTLTLRTKIAADGTIDLHIPSDLPPGDAEVVLVVQSAGSERHGPAVSISGLFADHEASEETVTNYLRQLRRESTEAASELIE